MNISANIVVFSSNGKNRYVLSTSPDFVRLPSLSVTEENKSKIEFAICDMLREKYIIASDLELVPQLIQLHSDFVSNKPEDVSMIYASVVNHSVQKSDRCYWLVFDALGDDNREQSELLMNCIRRLA